MGEFMIICSPHHSDEIYKDSNNARKETKALDISKQE